MERTCPHCGYARTFCQCGRKRNVDGSIRRRPWEDYTKNPDEYARTSSMGRRDSQQKWNHDRLPVNAEQLITYIQRSQRPIEELVEYSMHRHLFGTSKTWPCHTQSRHCMVCDLCQEVTTLRQLLDSMVKKYQVLNYDRIEIKEMEDATGGLHHAEVGLVEDQDVHKDPPKKRGRPPKNS
jgi:hypothetical protein